MRGFAIENDWYWRITENAQSFDAPSAVRDFVAPLARVARDTFALTELAAEGDEILFTLGDERIAIKVSAGAHDRVAINHFVGDLNRTLSSTGHAFALIVPRRYELQGALLSQDELAGLAGSPQLLVPSGRPSWRAIPAQ